MNPLSISCVALLGLSTLNYYLAESMLTGNALVAVVLIAVFVKLAIVIMTFMELGTQGRAWLLPVLTSMAALLTALALFW